MSHPVPALSCSRVPEVAAAARERPGQVDRGPLRASVAANQSRGSVHRVRAAVDEHGFILGLDDEFWFDQGGYLRTHGVIVTDLTWECQ